VLIAGIDLAWGEKAGDGVCLVEYRGGGGGNGTPRALVLRHAHLFGDEALLACLAEGEARVAEAGGGGGDGGAFLAFDAPMVCVNETGRRPVDAQVSATFRAQHAGCYPVNTRLAPRPLRLARRLNEERGFALDFGFGGRRAAEVFPHPALVRFLGLKKIIEYKRKPKRSRAHCEAEFARLRVGVGGLLRTHFPWLETGPETAALLEQKWSKPVEDQVDALVCALIGLWHVRHAGRRSEVFGDAATGFVVVPDAGSGTGEARV
jgi:predicted RNase H-like nuclease